MRKVSSCISFASYGTTNNCNSIGSTNNKVGYAKTTTMSTPQTTTTTATVIMIEANEKTPLLADQNKDCIKNCDSEAKINDVCKTYPDSGNQQQKRARQFKVCEFRLLGILLIFLVGSTIATYLLIKQSRSPNIRFSLDLVNREIWSSMTIPLGGLLNHSKVLNIIITHTEGRRCYSPEECMNALKTMQIQSGNKMELPYNFLIASDGQTYEVRGWDHESGYLQVPQDSSLLIGFIGNYSLRAPTQLQLLSALSLIRESIRRKKLQNQYQIYTVRNLTKSHSDGEALFKYVALWPRYDAMLNVL